MLKKSFQLLFVIIACFIVGVSPLMGKEMFIGYQLLEWQPQQRLTGKLILSDSPENVREIGILYEEKIDGLGRILFHHINESEDVKNLAIIICNKEGLKKQAKILKQEVMGPTKYILHAGQTLLERYFMGKQKGIITLDPYEEKILFMSLPNEWQPQLLLTGIIDFETDGIVEVIIAAIDKTTSISEIKKTTLFRKG